MDLKAHWETVYTTRAPEAVSWYQANPALSLALIAATGVGKDARLMDVGGGASTLVDKLLEAGFAHVTVLDISPTAMRRAQERLGPEARRVQWIEADIRTAQLPVPVDLWHDRAVFHFLTEAEDRVRYLAVLQRAVPLGGHVIIAAFAPEAPPKCSGLPVRRYDAEALQRELGGAFELAEARTEVHRTPGGVVQPFLYARFRKT